MYFINLRQLNKIQEILKTYIEYVEQYGINKNKIPKEDVTTLLKNMVDEILKAL